MTDEANQVRQYVYNKIFHLLTNKNDSATRAILAKLRRGIGKQPGGIPELWEITLGGLPEELTGKGSEATRGEWAVHTALTLYALHQQGKDISKQCMSQDGQSLGRSLRKLIDNEDDEKRIKRRFDAAATSNSLEEFSHHLRGLIQILKSEDIPLDYPALAKELYFFQFPEARDSVRLRWGRDFYRGYKEAEN
jgi:CRISPR system Cascade subunit CasB